MARRIYSVPPILAFLCLVFLAAHISSAHADGFNSAPGITTTPFGANGQTVLDMFSDAALPSPTNRVGINMGTTTPGVTLDVNGGTRPGDQNTVTACGMGKANGEGTLRYNYSTHTMEYCNGTGWAAAFGSSCTEYCDLAYGSSGNNTWYCKTSSYYSNGYSAPTGYMQVQAATGSTFWDLTNNMNYICVNGTWDQINGTTM